MLDENAPSPGTDPYGVLKLRPGAPRDLIEEAYWFLIGRQAGSREPEIERTQELRLLNEAYEQIVRGAVTKQVRAPAIPPKRRWQRRTEQAPEWLRDPFETLYLRRHAERQLAAIAGRVLGAHIPRGLKKEDWHNILLKAVAEVVAHSDRARDADPERVDASVETAGETRTSEAAEVAPSDGPRTAAGEAAESVTSETAEAVTSETAEPAGEPKAPSAAHEAEGDLEVAEATVSAPLLTQPPDLDVARDVEVAAHEQATEIEPPAHGGVVEAREVEPAAEPDRAAAHTPLFGRVLGRAARADAMQGHLQDRLMQLRVPAAASTPATNGPVNVKHAGDGAPVTKPTIEVLSCRDVTEDGIDITLGAGPEAAAVRVWRRGDTCLLQQLSGAVVLVNGQPLHSPIVVLEDSDQIRHEDNVLTLQDA